MYPFGDFIRKSAEIFTAYRKPYNLVFHNYTNFERSGIFVFQFKFFALILIIIYQFFLFIIIIHNNL